MTKSPDASVETHEFVQYQWGDGGCWHVENGQENPGVSKAERCGLPLSAPVHQTHERVESEPELKPEAPERPTSPKTLYAEFEEWWRTQDYGDRASAEAAYIQGRADHKTPLCPVHQQIEDSRGLEMPIGGLNCLACTLHERVELLGLLAPFADGSADSVTTLRKVIGVQQKCHQCNGSGFQAGYGGNHHECVFCLGTGIDKTYLIEPASSAPAQPEAQKEYECNLLCDIHCPKEKQ